MLGVLLILLGIASFGFYIWGNAPMVEPANPGIIENPKHMIPPEEWRIRFFELQVRFHKYGAIPAGVVGIIVGALLLLPEKARRG